MPTSVPTSRAPRPRVVLVFAVLLGASLGITLACWGTASQLSGQFSSGYTITLRTMPTYDGYSYQMYEIVPDGVAAAPTGTVPCVLFIHGLGGSKEILLHHALSVAGNGYVVLVPDTRGQNSHTGPFSFGVDDITDLRNLITWVEASTHLPMVNKSSIGVFGHSMGALLAMLLAAQDDRVSCTVEASGPSNMTRVLETEWFRISLIGSPVDINDEEAIRRRTPLTHVNATNPRNFMIVHGTMDTSVPFDHALDLNASVNPLGNRADFQLISYDSNHNLDHPAPGNASRTCFQDAIARAVLWYDEHLAHDTSRTYEDVTLFERDALAAGMNQAYQVMYGVLLVTIVLAFFTAALGLQLAWVKVVERVPALAARARETESDAAPVPAPAPVPALPPGRAMARQLAYAGVYLASFAITGAITLASPVSLVLKTVIFPVLPLVPVVILKVRSERGSAWFRDLGLDGPRTIVSVGAAFLAFGLYVWLYNALTTGVYARVTLVQYVLQGGTGIALPPLFWHVLPGIVALFIVDALYFQELYTRLAALVKPPKLVAVLDTWFVRALLVALLVGGIHTIGTVLFNIALPDYDLRTIGSLQFMFKELLAILSMGIIVTFVFMTLFATKLTRNLPGAALVLALVLAMVYVTVVPRIF